MIINRNFFSVIYISCILILFFPSSNFILVLWFFGTRLRLLAIVVTAITTGVLTFQFGTTLVQPHHTEVVYIQSPIRYYEIWWCDPSVNKLVSKRIRVRISMVFWHCLLHFLLKVPHHFEVKVLGVGVEPTVTVVAPVFEFNKILVQIPLQLSSALSPNPHRRFTACRTDWCEQWWTVKLRMNLELPGAWPAFPD